MSLKGTKSGSEEQDRQKLCATNNENASSVSKGIDLFYSK